MVRSARIALPALVLTLAACGGGDEGGGEDLDVVTEDEPTTLGAPATPSPEQCAADRLEASSPPDDLVPPPGEYSYEVQGTRSTAGGASGEARLPRRATFTVTEPRSVGRLRCFVVHRPYAPQIADQTTFAVRGGEAFVTSVRAIAGGRLVELAPDPPVKALSGEDLEWSGAFRGSTRGRYAGSLLGRRTIRVGGRAVRAVGVELRLSLAGDLRGTSVTRTWFSQDSNVVVQEEVRQDRGAGGERLVLDYRARIVPEDLPR